MFRLSIWFALVVCVGALNAGADNIVPPNFAGTDPDFETFQEWEFRFDTVSAPDGQLGFDNDGGTPTVTPRPGVAHEMLGVGLFPALDGFVGTFGVGNTLTFDIPNIVDDRPVKHLRIQVNGDWTQAFTVPTVVSLTGVDADDEVGSSFVESEETFPGFHRWEDWDMFPNPDAETLVLTVPVGGIVSQVVIHTISTGLGNGITGDYNDSGQVEQGDLDLVLQNWGVDTDTAGVPAGWTQDLPSGQIEQTELDGVLQNWGNTSTPDFGGSSVPEPAAGLFLAFVLAAGHRRVAAQRH